MASSGTEMVFASSPLDRTFVSYTLFGNAACLIVKKGYSYRNPLCGGGQGAGARGSVGWG